MEVKLIKIGFGNFIASNKIIGILTPESLPAKRTMRTAQKWGKLINANYGRKTKSIILMDNDYVILSSINLENIKK